MLLNRGWERLRRRVLCGVITSVCALGAMRGMLRMAFTYKGAIFYKMQAGMGDTVFTPLYQYVIPAFLFGAAFSVDGRRPGLSATLGTEDLPGFIFR